ncbi:WecB/TagA/CpsF family glycosyltransferase [Neorhizobium sp. CSC1952]|uniref:WecB/TagA/CpsF family glycosyltransferase n=1 Tax=Neorhizobium sp. CSC1952 TaxID=2978974 RepID=UPI0025A689AB|nr:WecB/TagA/CpsF family glycosyltransferase [Rhizobium sp. CSC1952]WJR68288.1 WecB/TagA/CpsF family glycosyltransferase [Rhizobium sp. CSC1952]
MALQDFDTGSPENSDRVCAITDGCRLQCPGGEASAICSAPGAQGLGPEDEAKPASDAAGPPIQGDPLAFPSVLLGGLPITAVDRRSAASLMIAIARRRRHDSRPYYFTSANGEVIARVHADPKIASLFLEADQILADGQPLVTASQWLCRVKLPERVATTDLFHDVARLAEKEGITFYLLGSTEAENLKAVAAIRARYSDLRIIGHCHGYLAGEALEQKLDEINALAPDILWLGLGVPREQIFVHDFAARLANVGIIKTSGGLFDHLAGKTRRAPLWMQKAGFEWFWRMLMEPRRLFWRYITTNPRALYVILRYSK